MSNISDTQIFDDIFIYLRFCVFVRLQCVFSWGGLVMAGPLGRGCFSGGGGRFITGQLMSSRSSISWKDFPSFRYVPNLKEQAWGQLMSSTFGQISLDLALPSRFRLLFLQKRKYRQNSGASSVHMTKHL